MRQSFEKDNEGSITTSDTFWEHKVEEIKESDIIDVFASKCADILTWSSTRITFSEIQDTDKEGLYTLYSNEKVRQYLGGTLNKHEYDKRFLLQKNPREPLIYRVVKEIKTKEVIGLMIISPIDENMDYEITYKVHPDYWGQGFGYEIASYAIFTALYILKLPKVYGIVEVDNLNSVRILEKLGMKLTGTMERQGKHQLVYLLQK